MECLGLEPWMVDADESPERWRPPITKLMLSVNLAKDL